MAVICCYMPVLTTTYRFIIHSFADKMKQSVQQGFCKVKKES